MSASPAPGRREAADGGAVAWPAAALVAAWSGCLVAGGAVLPATPTTWTALGIASAVVALTTGVIARRWSRRTDRRLDDALGAWERSGYHGPFPAEDVAPELRWIVDRVNHLAVRIEDENRRLERFSLAASHELRNPLAAARAYLELAQRRLRAAAGGAGDGKISGGEYVDHALREVDRLWLLVEGLLLLARNAPAGGPFESHPVRLADVVADAVEIVRPAAALKDQTIEVDTDPTALVAGDRQRLYLAVFKLADNAVRFTPRGGTLHVRAERRDRTAVIEVEDQGPGIPEAGMPEILGYFEPATRSHTGASLGLSLVQRVVQSHGGSLEALPASRCGTRFRIHLPVLLYPVDSLESELPGISA
ncbi:MAG: HAMP domain-containing histidine kinase [Acidobacteria bacterium]|nr:HAMP domain-containing histidine kinase [Acidobacteriota bacterium]